MHKLWGLPHGTKVLWAASDEKWFYGLAPRANSEACPELGLEKQSYSAHHKSHIDKVMVHATVAYAFDGGPENGGDGLLLGLHRCQAHKIFLRNVYHASKDPVTGRTKYRGNPLKYEKGKAYLVDANVTGSNRGTISKPCFALKDLWEHAMFETIEKLVGHGGKYENYQVVFQEDNAGPHQEGNYSSWLESEFSKRGWMVRLQAPQGPYTNPLDLALFPGMSKRHSEQLQLKNNTVATKEAIWSTILQVWGRTSSADVARSFVQAYRVMARIITEGGNNHWLQSGGPHCGVRRDYIDTPTGCKKRA